MCPGLRGNERERRAVAAGSLWLPSFAFTSLSLDYLRQRVTGGEAGPSEAHCSATVGMPAPWVGGSPHGPPQEPGVDGLHQGHPITDPSQATDSDSCALCRGSGTGRGPEAWTDESSGCGERAGRSVSGEGTPDGQGADLACLPRRYWPCPCAEPPGLPPPCRLGGLRDGGGWQRAEPTPAIPCPLGADGPGVRFADSAAQTELLRPFGRL